MVHAVDFHAFIPRSLYEDQCYKLQTALTCVENIQKANKGCHEMLQLPFHMQKQVVQAVCISNRPDYMESVDCFTQPKVSTHLKESCLGQLLKNQSCSTLDTIKSCVYDVIKMTHNCTPKHAKFMQQLFFLYTSWFHNMHRCPVDSIDLNQTTESIPSSTPPQLEPTTSTISTDPATTSPTPTELTSTDTTLGSTWKPPISLPPATSTFLESSTPTETKLPAMKEVHAPRYASTRGTRNNSNRLSFNNSFLLLMFAIKRLIF
ncbi:uncharacterized protein LOC131958548 [Physella acuta]|uniref:uncharacterized protein LOC131958548 n=1 Tax=Physella acuta TaxID=109671 RepID=UPI0027DC3628|nr:uncharacterized protein LOC131958548 [Physella acuta]